MAKVGKSIERVKVDVVGVQVTFNIRMITGGGQTKFFVDEPDLGIKVEGDDLSKVRAEAKKLAEGSITCDWEDFFQVRVERDLDSRYSRDGIKVEFNFRWNRLQIGTRGNGSKCWRDAPTGDHWHDRNIRVREGEPDAIRLKDEEDFVEVIVPASPLNELALLSFRAAIESLANQLLEMFDGNTQAGATLIDHRQAIQAAFFQASEAALNLGKKKAAKKSAKKSAKKGRR